MRTAIQETGVYTFDELDEEGKEAAREWYRQDAMHDGWHDSIYGDAERVAAILGIDFDEKRIPLMNGETRGAPKIWFSGFCSQGDGACFEGSYSYAKGSAKRIREYAPQDATLHAIADNLAQVQKRHFYSLKAHATHSGHYYHSGCMAVDVTHVGDEWRDIGTAQDDVKDELRGFADWIYAALEKESEYLESDEVIDESIRANEYEFTADGGIY